MQKPWKSEQDTISLNVDSRNTKKLKFLVDTGGEISILKSPSLTPGVNYQLHEDVDIKGISYIVMRTKGIIDLKPTHIYAREGAHISCTRRTI